MRSEGITGLLGSVQKKYPPGCQLRREKLKIKENLKILRTLAEIQCKQSLIVGKLSREG